MLKINAMEKEKSKCTKELSFSRKCNFVNTNSKILSVFNRKTTYQNFEIFIFDKRFCTFVKAMPRNHAFIEK